MRKAVCEGEIVPCTGSTSRPSELITYKVWLSTEISIGQFRNSALISLNLYRKFCKHK